MNEPATGEGGFSVGNSPPEQGPTNQEISGKDVEPVNPQSPSGRPQSEQLPPGGSAPSIAKPPGTEQNLQSGKFHISEASKPGENLVGGTPKPKSLSEELGEVSKEPSQVSSQEKAPEEIQPTSRQSTIPNETSSLTRSLYELYARRFRLRRSISQQQTRAKREAKG